MDSPVTVTTSETAVVAQIDDGEVNAISQDVLAALNAALDQAQEARLPVVFLGRERIFSAGFDLKVLDNGAEAFADLVTNGADLLQRMVSAPVPVIVGATGHAVAMGALMLMAADFRIGTEGKFKIGLNEVAIGMTLPHFAMTLAGERLSKRHFVRATSFAELYRPEVAVDVGYLDHVVAPDELEAAALQKAESAAQLSRGAFEAVKERARGDLGRALTEAIAQDRADLAAAGA